MDVYKKALNTLQNEIRETGLPLFTSYGSYYNMQVTELFNIAIMLFPSHTNRTSKTNSQKCVIWLFIVTQRKLNNKVIFRKCPYVTVNIIYQQASCTIWFLLLLQHYLHNKKVLRKEFVLKQDISVTAEPIFVSQARKFKVMVLVFVSKKKY